MRRFGSGRRSWSSRGRRNSAGGRRLSSGHSPKSRETSSGKSRSKRSSSKQGNVVAYSIYSSRGKRTYVGTTNDPDRRAGEHENAGKLKRGGRLVVESKRMSRKAAEQLEAKKIRGYKRRMGRLPKDNKTSDGQYHS